MGKYLIFIFMHYILYCIINKGLEIQSLKHLLFVNTDGLPIAGALWFLTALFFADMFYYFISRLKKIYKVLLVIFISVFGNIATLILPFRLPFALDVACVGVGLMYIGGLIKSYRQNKYVDKILNINIFWGIVIAMISAILIKANSYVNMTKGEYEIIPLFWINAVLSSFVIFVVSKYIDKYCFKWLKQYVVGIGKDSITYLCFPSRSENYYIFPVAPSVAFVWKEVGLDKDAERFVLNVNDDKIVENINKAIIEGEIKVNVDNCVFGEKNEIERMQKFFKKS